VPGLGPAKRRALLRHFGGLQGVLRAGADLARSKESARCWRAAFMITCIPGRRTEISKMLWTLPNILTWMRILAIPLVVVLFYLPFHWSDPAAGLLFAAAGITDSLDGYSPASSARPRASAPSSIRWPTS
jgi:hypothetical protein